MRIWTTVFALLTLLSAATGVKAQNASYHYIDGVLDTITVDAGNPSTITVRLRNMNLSAVTLTSRIAGDPQFSMDSADQVLDLDPGHRIFIRISVAADTGGTYTTLFTVTDGTVTDSVRLTAIVNHVPFVILPSWNHYYADKGVPLRVTATVKNRTAQVQSLNLSLTGDAEYSLLSASSFVLQPLDTHTVELQFLASSEGTFNATLEASDGNYTTTATFNINSVDRPWKWMSEFQNDITVMERRYGRVFVLLRNTAPNPVTLDVSLSGDPGFQVEAANQQVIVDNYMQLPILFRSDVLGRHTALLSVTDGVDVDTVTLVATLVPSTASDFTVDQIFAYIETEARVTDSTVLNVRNQLDTPLTVTAALNGDRQFSIAEDMPLVIPALGVSTVTVKVESPPVGEFNTMVAISDGHTADTVRIRADVDAPKGGNSMFRVEPPLRNGEWIFFKSPPGGTAFDTLTIYNMYDSTITVHFDLSGAGGQPTSDFALSRNSVTIDSGMSAPVIITFSNPPMGIAQSHLSIHAGGEGMSYTLHGETVEWSNYAGLLMKNYLDFGEVDSTTQFCLDLLLMNTTAQKIDISDIKLIGLAPDYSLPSSASFSINAGDTASIRVCYTPTTQVYQDNDMLTFTYDNPSATPRMQSVLVNIRGRTAMSYSQLDTLRKTMLVHDQHTMVAPIDGYVEKTFTLHNLLDHAIVFDTAHTTLRDNVFTFLTPFPITLPALDAQVPGSGTTTIRVRYAPTSALSVPNEEDQFYFSFNDLDTMYNVMYSVGFVGKPLTPIPSSNVIALYPENQLPPIVTLGEVQNQSRHTLRFRNNLTVPVTITSCGLASGSYAEIVDNTDLPVVLQPDETIRIELKIIADVQELTSDEIIMHGTHEHLNSRYEIFTGKMATGIERLPAIPAGITVHAAPNPSSGPVVIRLGAVLDHGHIRILNAIGHTVAEFDANGQWLQWSGKDLDGRALPAGSYFIHVTGMDAQRQRVSAWSKLVLIP